MKTLKEKFIDDLKDGSKLVVSFRAYDSYATRDNEIITATYIKVKNVMYRIEGSNDTPCFIDIKDIEHALKIFNADYKDVNIIKISEPFSYTTTYENILKPRFTKKEIEKILGYEIEIIEED